MAAPILTLPDGSLPEAPAPEAPLVPDGPPVVRLAAALPAPLAAAAATPPAPAPSPPPLGAALAGSSLGLLLALPISLLPERWRERFPALPLALATGLTGGGEMLSAILLARWRLLALASAVAAEGPLEQAATPTGALLFLALLFSPWGLLALLLLVEGAVRLLSAAALGEPCGVAILHLVEGARTLGRRLARRRPRPAPADLVAGDGAEGVLICAARPYDWAPLDTIRYQGRLYRLVEIRDAPGPLPWRHRLAPLPEGRLIRRLVDYPAPGAD